MVARTYGLNIMTLIALVVSEISGYKQTLNHFNVSKYIYYNIHNNISATNKKNLLKTESIKIHF